MTSEKWGYINCRVGHKRPRRLIRRVRRILNRHDFDVLVLVEAAPYYMALAGVIGRHSSYKVTQYPGARNGNCAIITRKPVNGSTLRNTSPGWIRAKRNRHKGFHPGRTSLLVNHRGLRVLVSHGPPRPHRKGVFQSRLRARNIFFRRSGKILDGWSNKGRKYLMIGDMNTRFGGAFLKSFARKHNLTRHGRGIDGALAGGGAQVRRVRRHRLRGWFDHPMLSFIVRY